MAMTMAELGQLTADLANMAKTAGARTVIVAVAADSDIEELPLFAVAHRGNPIELTGLVVRVRVDIDKLFGK
jgi:hypothetical protein